MTSGILALIIIAAILAQVAVVALVTLYRRRQQYRAMGETSSEAASRPVPQTPVSSAESSAPTLAWDGFREFTVQRREYEDANRSICSFYLKPVDGQPLPPFQPGQFLTFKLPIKDPVTGQSKTVVRCYSLSDSPRVDYYRVSIKRAPAPANRPDAPAGLSSNFFHDHMQEGSRLSVKAPSGHFHLMEKEPRPMVLIGGGIGVTPMLSILNTVLESGIEQEVWLYYGVLNGREHIMKGPLQALASRHKNFHLYVCYSAPRDSDVEGIDYQHHGRIDITLLQTTLTMQRYQFYVCGPKAMMESMIPALVTWGMASSDIYYESFGPATLIKHEKAAAKTAATQPITVTFNHSGKSIPWDPTADSLLEFAEANGIEVVSGCRAGSCGSCQTAVKHGEVDYNQQPDIDVLPDHCLLCISTPQNNLTLDA
jgi:ferredoxin-NADP reductase